MGKGAAEALQKPSLFNEKAIAWETKPAPLTPLSQLQAKEINQ